MFERMLCEPPRLYIVGLSESLGGHSALSTMMDRIDLAVNFRKVKPPTSVVDIFGRMRLSASETQDAKVHRWRVGYTCLALQTNSNYAFGTGGHQTSRIATCVPISALAT